MQLLQFREHRGAVEDAKKTLVNLEPTKTALTKHVYSLLKGWYQSVEPQDLTVSMYTDYPDSRFGWDRTFVVVMVGYGVVGFINGEI